jgi:hypothetical protein
VKVNYRNEKNSCDNIPLPFSLAFVQALRKYYESY